jgi:hypothetical protein
MNRVLVELQVEEARMPNLLERLAKVPGLTVTMWGWWCPGCGTFNGEAKHVIDKCRSCGGAR